MTCYFPNGAQTHDQPCNATAEVSHCCSKSSICLDNGFCLNAGDTVPYTLSRGTCTDYSFLSPSCPQRCKDVSPRNGATLAIAPASGGITQYCCVGTNKSVIDSSGQCLQQSLGQEAPFSITRGYVIWNRTTGSTQQLDAASTLMAADASQSPQILHKGTSHDAAIGAAVGVPLGILFLIALAISWIQYRRNKELQMQLAQSQAYGSPNAQRDSEPRKKSLPPAESQYGALENEAQTAGKEDEPTRLQQLPGTPLVEMPISWTEKR